MAATFKQNRIYFGGFLILLLATTLLLTLVGKEAGFIAAGNEHPLYLNIFFINYTFMGDGIFVVCLIAASFIYFKKRKLGFAMLYSFLICGIAVQLIKNFFNLSGAGIYFESGTYLNFIKGVTPASQTDQFISGHTATAFAIATVIVLMFKKRKYQLLILTGAALVGFSRMYLAQHFLSDIMAGSLLGTVSGMAAFYLVQNKITIEKPVSNMYPLPSSGGNIQPA